MITIILWE